MVDINLDVHHITRVEGHGNIIVNVENGLLQECDLEIIEAPRYFEAMLRGTPYEQAPYLASRICGICAVAHTTTSIRAVEKALGVAPSQQTQLLRKLNIYGEMLDSHILHVYMLVAPDLLGLDSVIPLAKTAPDVLYRALRMKKMAGNLCGIICGRHTHPIAMTVGGFSHFPSKDELNLLAEELFKLQADVVATIELFQGLQVPDFERDTEFMALVNDKEYCFIDGAIASSDGNTWPVEEYEQVTNEYLVNHSSAKHTKNQRQSYMVGALARFNINYDLLHPKAKEAAHALGLQPKCINPYKNSLAQVVEIAHCTEEAIGIVDQLSGTGIQWEKPVEPTRLSGDGVGACEAPRGTLYHDYGIKSGYITDANCIIPTGQNLANVEADMRALVPKILDRDQAQIRLALEMLVRAYDPCISCSTHMLEVKFV